MAWNIWWLGFPFSPLSLPPFCILFISFPVPNLVPPHSMASQFSIAAHTWLSPFNMQELFLLYSLSVYSINAFPCILTAFFPAAANINPSLSDQQTCCCWEGLVDVLLLLLLLVTHFHNSGNHTGEAGKSQDCPMSSCESYLCKQAIYAVNCEEKLKWGWEGTFLLQFMKSKYLSKCYVCLVCLVFVCFGFVLFLFGFVLF